MKKTISIFALLILFIGCNKEQPALKDGNSASQVLTESVTINSVCYSTATDNYAINVTFSGADVSTQTLAVGYYSNDCGTCDPDADPILVSYASRGSNGTYTINLPTNAYGVNGYIKAVIIKTLTPHTIFDADIVNVTGVTCN